MAEGAPQVAARYWSEEGCESLLDLAAAFQPDSLGDALAAELTEEESRAVIRGLGPGLTMRRFSVGPGVTLAPG